MCHLNRTRACSLESSRCLIAWSQKMKAPSAVVCFLVLALFAGPGFADNTISAAASACGTTVTISGVICLDTGYTFSETTVNIEIFPDGGLVRRITARRTDSRFSGTLIVATRGT